MKAKHLLWAVAALGLVLAAATPAVLWMTDVPGKSFEGTLPPITAEEGALSERLRIHVGAIGRVPHNVKHPQALERAALHIEGALTESSYEVVRQPFKADGFEVRNIEVVIEPAASTPSPRTLVVGAHYDSHMDAPGANDNATGTAAVIELARSLADLRGKAAVRIRLVLFVNEEPPYFHGPDMGSLVYAKRLKATGEPVMGMLSLETLGFYSDEEGSQKYPPPLSLLYPSKGDFVAFVGMIPSRDFLRETVASFREKVRFPSVGGTAPGFVPGIDWSDHWSFEQVGIPALMVTDTAPFRYPHYHTLQDTPDKIDYDRLARVVAGLERVIRGWAGNPK